MSLTTYKRAAHYRDQRGLSHVASMALTADAILTYYVDGADAPARIQALGYSPRQSRRLIKRARQALPYVPYRRLRGGVR